MSKTTETAFLDFQNPGEQLKSVHSQGVARAEFGVECLPCSQCADCLQGPMALGTRSVGRVGRQVSVGAETDVLGTNSVLLFRKLEQAGWSCIL